MCIPFSFGIFNSFFDGLGRNQVSMGKMFYPNWDTNQFKPVQQSRKQTIRGYCPNIYTVSQGKFGTYAKFYQHFFVSNKEVIGCSKKLSNLLKNCLSPLVPHEPASVLRTHLSNQIQAKSLYTSHEVSSRFNTL